MVKTLINSLFFIAILSFSSLEAHIPSLLLPIEGPPISSFFVNNSDISRTIFSELTNKEDFFVVTMFVKPRMKMLVQVLTPKCENIPRYEKYQPSALIIRGELPWKKQGETNKLYISRIKKLAIRKIETNFADGNRPQFYEEFAQMTYWVGGSWRGRLHPGLYSIVIYDKSGDIGNFNLSLNEKEKWTPDLYNYVSKILPIIKAGFCNPKGFSGNLTL